MGQSLGWELEFSSRLGVLCILYSFKLKNPFKAFFSKTKTAINREHEPREGITQNPWGIAHFVMKVLILHYSNNCCSDSISEPKRNFEKSSMYSPELIENANG